MKTYRNLLIVFFLTGMWHGAGWTFIIWGLFHGLFQILERLFLGKALAKVLSMGPKRLVLTLAIRN